MNVQCKTFLALRWYKMTFLSYSFLVLSSFFVLSSWIMSNYLTVALVYAMLVLWIVTLQVLTKLPESVEEKQERIKQASSRCPRALSGWNVFCREKMTGSSLTTHEYKSEIKQLGPIWKSMSAEEREPFMIQAQHEQLQREELVHKPLPPKGEGKTELELQVGRAGCKKLSIKRLEANEQAFNEHPAWLGATQLGDGFLALSFVAQVCRSVTCWLLYVSCSSYRIVICDQCVLCSFEKSLRSMVCRLKVIVLV